MKAEFDVEFTKKQTLIILFAALKSALTFKGLEISFQDADMESIILNGKLIESIEEVEK